ncbi:MAG: endonuclease domain-containing protein [Candidatus Paceibacterota bacterium]
MTILKNKSQLLFRRRELRKKQTKQEEILWQCIRNRKLGVKFKRQYSIGGYVLDFYCPEIKLAIEIDGIQHSKKEEVLYDQERTEYLEILGCKVLRFKNLELENNLGKVLLRIKKFTPSPYKGEGVGMR